VLLNLRSSASARLTIRNMCLAEIRRAQSATTSVRMSLDNIQPVIAERIPRIAKPTRYEPANSLGMNRTRRPQPDLGRITVKLDTSSEMSAIVRGRKTTVNPDLSGLTALSCQKPGIFGRRGCVLCSAQLSRSLRPKVPCTSRERSPGVLPGSSLRSTSNFHQAWTNPADSRGSAS